MHANDQQKNDDRRRSWTISIVFHSLIFLLAVIPFMVEDKSESEFTRAIAIQFDEPSTRQSGRAQAASGSRASREEVAMASLRPRQPVNPLTTPQQRDIITGPEPVLPVQPEDTYFDDPLEANDVTEVDNIEALPDAEPVESTFEDWEISDVEEYADAPAPLSKSASNGGDGTSDGTNAGNSEWYENLQGDAEHGAEDPFADGFFTDDWPGEGEGSAGKNIGVGNDGQGRYWGDFAGDGLFNRKVIKRANVARLAIEEGRIAIKLCVNQIGEVVFTKFDAVNSSISDPALIARAEDCAAHYVFDEDPTAPRQQCGKLTFIFKIDK